MLSIRFDEERKWWVSSHVFDRLFEAALARGQLEPELEDWQHVAHANGGFGFDVDEVEVGEKIKRALVATARSELAALRDIDLQSDDGTYKVSLEKLLALARP